MGYMNRIIQTLRYGGNPKNNLSGKEFGTKGLRETEIKHSLLPIEVLPSHRIIANSSVLGRVAFVRQLPHKPEFVLEYNKEVKNQLNRFGFSVILYNKIEGKSKNVGL